LRRAAPDAAGLPFAVPDYTAGGRLATDHLLALGVHQIAFVGGLEGREVTVSRMSGYLAALAAAGIAPLHLPGRPGRSFGREVATRLTRHYPGVDAVLCFNDLVALGLLTGCAELGRKVGTDLLIIGFDDIEDCSQAWPALSSVSCDIAAFARTMAVTVLRWLEDGTPPPSVMVTPVTLVPRASSLGTR
jgi:LacI family transcriptional regulator